MGFNSAFKGLIWRCPYSKGRQMLRLPGRRELV
jgi:hypothetical protein